MRSVLHSAAARQLAKIADAITQCGIAAKCAVGTANDTAMEIVRIAEHHQADLRVIAAHGMSGWRELAFGSVAEKVVRYATMPVLVLRARPQQEPNKLAASDDDAVAPCCPDAGQLQTASPDRFTPQSKPPPYWQISGWRQCPNSCNHRTRTNSSPQPS